ncbi:MAG: formylmethanofuran dehydrogenase [Clostridiales bacterium]|nr:formylmethanofuran dehydrogenase [Clostridiales bacterium]
MDKDLKFWNKVIDFHGHVCGGLTIGYKAALYAMELLECDFSHDEEIVCVTETDACCVDAIQVILGCSVGKGNLLFRLRGKQAFSFYNRKNGKSVRLVLKELDHPNRNHKEEWQKFLFDSKVEDLFDVKEPSYQLPENARIFESIKCECCNEMTADYFIRIQNGKKVCTDCFHTYDRFF